MGSFSLSVQTDTPAFETKPAAELARILRRLADQLDRQGIPDSGIDNWPLADYDGNLVGRARIQLSRAYETT